MKRWLCAAFVCVLLVSAGMAQAPQGPPKPAPELKRLGYFVGTWTAEGTTQPGPMGPGGKFTSVDKNAWDLGGFYLVTHSTFKGAGFGTGTEVAYFGYDPAKKVYTYSAFNSMGEAETATGTVNGNTWTWTSPEAEMGGQKYTGRFTLVEDSPSKYTMKYEVSTDGGNSWNKVMDGTVTKTGGASGASSKKGSGESTKK